MTIYQIYQKDENRGITDTEGYCTNEDVRSYESSYRIEEFNVCEDLE